MKKTILSILMATSLCVAYAQNIVYDRSGKKHYFKAEEIDIEFQRTSRQVEGPQLAATLLGILPTVVDIAFNLTQSALEKNVKKFSSSYTKQKSNILSNDGKLPAFTMTRRVKLEGDFENALTIQFQPKPVAGLTGFVYYVDNINLSYSAAKATRKSAIFDYTIELQITILEDKEKKVIPLSPIVISSVAFQNMQFPEAKHRSDIISFPGNAVITEISVKVAESNPAKVRAENILATWNENKDEVKTIINNVLPKEAKDSSGNTNESTNESNPSSTNNTPARNRQ